MQQETMWQIQRKYNGLLTDTEELKPYATRVNELSVDGQCLLWGERVIIPQGLHEIIRHNSNTGGQY